MADSKYTPDDISPERENWEQLYVLAGHWRSDLEFYLEDLRFLQRLLDRYALWIRSGETTTAVNELISDLHRLSAKGKKLLQMNRDHLAKLTQLINDAKNGKQHASLEDHARLEQELAGYVKEFRTHRRATYRLAEKLMNSEDIADPLNE